MPIYRFGIIELKTFKTYNKTNLANNFTWLFKSSIRAIILFFRKLSSSLYLCINYQSLNNLALKN